MRAAAPHTPRPFLLATRPKLTTPAARLFVVAPRPRPHRHIRLVDKLLIVLGTILLLAPAIAYLRLPPPPHRVYPTAMARLAILPGF